VEVKIAVVVYATDDFVAGARVLVKTIRKYGNVPENVTFFVMGQDTCDFAETLPAPDYSWLPMLPRYTPMASRLHCLMMSQFDRVIVMGADMMCIGDCSLLWSDNLGPLSLYAAPDCCQSYYVSQLAALDMDPAKLFGTDMAVYQNLPHTDFLEWVRSDERRTFVGTDAGYLNYYYQKVRPNDWGWLPAGYNYCLDDNMLPVEDKVFIHFTEPLTNKPWKADRSDAKDSQPYYARWREEA
jgi:hypothetical protein